MQHIRPCNPEGPVQTKTKKLEINLNIVFGRVVLSTVSVNKKKLWNHLRNPCLKRKGRNHPILSGCPVSVGKTSYKGGTKIVPFGFKYIQPLNS